MTGHEVWLVRHGQTEWSASGRHTSRTDLDLSEVGEEQARRVGEALAGHEFGAVLSSPLLRARRTAALAGFPDVVADDDLREWDYGEYEGLTTDTIRRTVPGWTVWTHPCPGGESASQVGARLDRVVARLRAQAGPVVLFGHGHALRVLVARWLGLPVEAGALFRLETATVSVLGYERETPALVRWNA